MPDEPLHEIDRALIALRHLWSAPAWLDDSQLGRVDLSTVWICEALSRRGHEPLTTVNDLAGMLGVAHSTASRLVDRAERAGVVSRGRSGSDGRRVTVTLAPAGRSLAQRSATFRARYLDRVLASWPDARRRTFAELLSDFAGSVNRTPPGKEHP